MSYMKRQRNEDSTINFIPEPEISGGDETKLPVWNVEITDEKGEIDSIIRKRDKAFAEPIAERAYYSDLLLKIHQKGIFLFAYGKEVLGYCAFYANDSDTKNAYISLIAVQPKAQNLHIGKYLLNKCFEISKNHGMQNCMLEVKKSNCSAIKFYQANDFVFYSERDDSFLMKRKLSSQKGKDNEHRRFEKCRV